MTWKQLTERDYREWKLSAINPHDKDTWRSGARFTKHLKPKIFVSPIQFVWYENLRLKMLSEMSTW